MSKKGTFKDIAKESAKELSEEQKAREVIAKAEQKRQQDFIDEYNVLCQKYGLELGASTSFQVVPYKR